MPTLLLTRPEDAATRFAAMMRARLGEINVITAPLFGIEIVAAPPVVLPDEGYVLTSENAVAAIVRHGLPLRRAYAVGDRTAAAARAAGLTVVSAQGDATALIDTVLAQSEVGPLLHLHGEHTRGDVAARLTAAGVPTRDGIAYLQPALTLPDAVHQIAQPVVAPVFSPRTGAILAQQWQGRAPLFLVAMSPAVAASLASLPHVSMMIADHPDARAMADAVQVLWQSAQMLEAQAGGA